MSVQSSFTARYKLTKFNKFIGMAADEEAGEMLWVKQTRERCDLFENIEMVTYSPRKQSKKQTKFVEVKINKIR